MSSNFRKIVGLVSGDTIREEDFSPSRLPVRRKTERQGHESNLMTPACRASASDASAGWIGQQHNAGRPKTFRRGLAEANRKIKSDIMAAAKRLQRARAS
jgi:hypothetical protein